MYNAEITDAQVDDILQMPVNGERASYRQAFGGAS